MLDLDEIISTLAQHKVRLRTEYCVNRIGVFGSYARGDQTAQSDIDFIVDFYADCSDFFDTKYRLKSFLTELFHKRVDLANHEAIKPYVMEEISREIKYA